MKPPVQSVLMRCLVVTSLASFMVVGFLLAGGLQSEGTAEGARSCERAWFSRCRTFSLPFPTTSSTTTTSSSTTTTSTTTADPSCTEPSLFDTNGRLIASGVPFPAATATGCLLLQVVPEPNGGFPAAPNDQQVPADGLFGSGSTAIPDAPLGWTRITPAVQYSQTSPTGSDAGVRMCFSVPSGHDNETLRLFYYDTDPAIDRWVGLDTTVDAGLACMDQTLRFPPRVFSLFAMPPV